MNPRSRLLSYVLLSGVVALTAAVGCNSLPNGSHRNELLITQVRGPHAKVTIDLSGLRGAFSRRQLLSHDPDIRVSTIRLSVFGPGMVHPVTATMPWVEDEGPYRDTATTQPTYDPSTYASTYPSGYPTNYPSTYPSVYPSSTANVPPAGPYSMALLVPAGMNRVFKIEGLNCQGKVIQTHRSLGTVQANVDLTVKINAANDAAARALENLLKGPLGGQIDMTSLRPSLASQDITAPLVAFVTRVTGYEVANNSFATISPTFFRVGQLVSAMWEVGRPLLTATQVPQTLSTSAASTVDVQVLNGATTPPQPLSGAEVFLFDPFELPAKYSVSTGKVTFQNVPPGTHTVMARYMGKIAWGTAVVGEGTPVFVQLTAQTPLVDPCPGLTHSASPSTMTTTWPSTWATAPGSTMPSSSASPSVP